MGKERRCLPKHANAFYTYESQALKANYFGPQVEFDGMEIICLIIQGQNPEVEFWVGTRNQPEFKVDFKKKGYTSFIETRKN